MFKTNYIYNVAPTDFIDKVFTSLPVNSFINKGRCGIGGTTLEINYKTRSTIIVAPTIGILKDKKLSQPDLLIVYGDININTIIDTLLLRIQGQKIMVTPDSFERVVRAFATLKRTREMYDDWFLLLDECHSFITEDYRPAILKPFDFFWHFRNKSVISATPYYFSDERFKELAYHEIKINGRLGKVDLVECDSVMGTLVDMLKNHHKCPGNIHVILNSVTTICTVIKLADLVNPAIFCARGKDDKNFKTLGELTKFYIEQPCTSAFKKINFYTSKYYEGWDMHDKDATIILVTDIHQPHTMLSVSLKLKQAVGRLRNPADSIIHVTNTRKCDYLRKPLNHYKIHFFADAERLLANDIGVKQTREAAGLKYEIDPRACVYADIDLKSKTATLNPFKVDQQINNAYSDESYNHINLLKEEWENANYDVENHYSPILNPPTKTTMRRKSKSQQLREDIEQLSALHNGTKNIYNFGLSMEENISTRNPLAVKAFKLLSLEVLESLGYNEKKVQQAVIVASNLSKETQLAMLLAKEFKVGLRYSRTRIKAFLQQCYSELSILNEKGEIKKADACQLGEQGWFELRECKMDDYKTHGFTIIRSSLAIRSAA